MRDKLIVTEKIVLGRAYSLEKKKEVYIKAA